MARAHGLKRHKRARAALLQAWTPGDPCARCGEPMQAGQRLHAEHLDTPVAMDPTATADALSHGRCNEYAGWALGYMLTHRRVPPVHQDRALERVRAQVVAQVRAHGYMDAKPAPTIMTRQSRAW